MKVFQRVQTEESLRYFKLDSSKYAALTQYPERLIRLLYEDCVADRFQTINSAAENISVIYGVNLKVLKRTLIQEWLPPIEHYPMDDFYNEADRITSSASSGFARLRQISYCLILSQNISWPQSAFERFSSTYACYLYA